MTDALKAASLVFVSGEANSGVAEDAIPELKVL